MNVSYQNYYAQQARREVKFSTACAIPFIGIPVGLIRAILGAKQALEGFIHFAKKDKSLSPHGWVQIKHGLANILAGCIEAIPLIGTISAICRVVFDSDTKLFMPYPNQAVGQREHEILQALQPESKPQPAVIAEEILAPVPEPMVDISSERGASAEPEPAAGLVSVEVSCPSLATSSSKQEPAADQVPQPVYDLSQLLAQSHADSDIHVNIEEAKKHLKVYEERLAHYNQKNVDGSLESQSEKVIQTEEIKDAIKTTLQILEKMEKFNNIFLIK